jgi:hypothetical protein
MKRVFVIVLLLVLLVLTAVTLAQPNSFTISWWTVDGGGGRASGGEYALSGTGGQFDAHTAATGGDYAVNGGFWQTGAMGKYEVFLPVVVVNQ